MSESSERAPAVKLSIARGGGIAGIATRTQVSTDSLSATDAETLRAMVEDAGLLTLSDDVPARPPHADDLLYELTVEIEGHVHTVHVTESTLPEAVRLLIAWADSLPAAEHRMA